MDVETEGREAPAPAASAVLWDHSLRFLQPCSHEETPALVQGSRLSWRAPCSHALDAEQKSCVSQMASPDPSQSVWEG